MCNLELADICLFLEFAVVAASQTGFKSASESNLYAQVIAQKQLLERLFQHEMGLPEGRLRRAVSYGGNNERLQRALHKLIRGDPITVATVGGSVTGALWRFGSVNGSCQLALFQLYNCTLITDLRVKHRAVAVLSLVRMHDWQNAFPAARRDI